MTLVMLFGGVLFYVIGIFVAYAIIKAAVRNGTIEAYIKLRREGLYPPQ